MPITTNPFISKYSAIVLAAIYGLIMRLFFNFGDLGINFTDLFSITFIWIVPIVVGTVPMLLARREQLESSYRILSPVASVMLFFIICFISRLEDVICIVIIALPFLTGAALGGIVVSKTILNHRAKKGIIYSILFVPIILGSVEERFKTPSQIFEINTSTVINATPQQIWQNVVRVKKIKESEYSKGFFNSVGIPKPLYAELNADTIGAIRTGHFEGGLRFKETVNHWVKNKKVSFDIQVIPSSIRSTVFDQHMLKGGHFKFLNAAYTIKPINESACLVTLTSSYKLDTKVNIYASFWGNWMLEDFQERLLAVIKKRCDGIN